MSTANTKGPQLKPTPRQRALLASYLPDILHGEHARLAKASAEDFIATVSAMDFDGQCARADVRVARNLNAKGAFSDFDVHEDIAGQPCLYVCISAVGAAAIYEIMRAGRP